ncbi:MAG: hypothetical protein N2691_03015 [Patescibacteria group bacterium]|nr:hypothetical protein [Patescibacteria group bacterium]
MEIQSSVALYLLFGIIVFQFITIAVLAYYYDKKTRTLESAEYDHSKAFTYVVDRANAKAGEILEGAVDKAEGFIHETKLLKDKIEERAAHMLDDSLEKHRQAFNEMFQQIFSQYKHEFETMKRSMEKEVDTSVADFEKFAKTEISELKDDAEKKNALIEQYLKQKIDAEFELARKEITAFKQQEFQRVSAQIREQVTRITRDVLRLSIPTDQHDKLIMDALEKAKENSFFRS